MNAKAARAIVGALKLHTYGSDAIITSARVAAAHASAVLALLERAAAGTDKTLRSMPEFHFAQYNGDDAQLYSSLDLVEYLSAAIQSNVDLARKAITTDAAKVSRVCALGTVRQVSLCCTTELSPYSSKIWLKTIEPR